MISEALGPNESHVLSLRRLPQQEKCKIPDYRKQFNSSISRWLYLQLTHCQEYSKADRGSKF